MFEGQILIAVYGKRIFVLVYSSQDCLFFSFLFFFLLSLFLAAVGLHCFVQIARGACLFVVASLNAEPGL